MEMKKTTRSVQHPKLNIEFRRAFTLIELLVVLAIIAMLVSLIMPAISSATERARATKDMNNLRQIAVATQTYLNDNDGAYFLPSTIWMNSLKPKYLSNWKIFQSPFDKRTPSEAGDASTPLSYGFNTNAQSSGAALLSARITNPSVFILFAPAQSNATTVTFTGTAATSGLTVDKNGGGSQGVAVGGTHTNRKRINACMADLHIENMLWSVYMNSTNSSSDASASQRWNP